jgi:hypothetical protein
VVQPEEIKLRFRRKLIANLIAVVVIAPPAFVLVDATKGSSSILGALPTALIVASLVVVVAIAVFAVVTWRCPACGCGLGKAVYPSTCPRCRARLR